MVCTLYCAGPGPKDSYTSLQVDMDMVGTTVAAMATAAITRGLRKLLVATDTDMVAVTVMAAATGTVATVRSGRK